MHPADEAPVSIPDIHTTDNYIDNLDTAPDDILTRFLRGWVTWCRQDPTTTPTPHLDKEDQNGNRDS